MNDISPKKSKCGTMKIPIQIENADGNNNAFIEIDDGFINIIWMSSSGEEEVCYFEDLELEDQKRVREVLKASKEKKEPTEQEKIEGAVLLYITHMPAALAKRLGPLTEQHKRALQKENVLFHEEIKNQFETLVRREVADQIANDMFLEPDKVYIVVESLDVPSFLKSLPGNKE